MLPIEVGRLTTHILLGEVLVKGLYDLRSRGDLRIGEEHLGEHPVAMHGAMPVVGAIEGRMELSGGGVKDVEAI